MLLSLTAATLLAGCARGRPPASGASGPVASARDPAGGPPALAPALAPLAKSSTAAAKWDLATMPGETFDAKIDVREGTWLGVDVSPDGAWIAFDLLGDLYLLPAAGGEARVITSGPAWDMQPRFSPDGRWIAFISDRDGMDNLWLVEPSGANPRAVTRGTDHELSSPAWAPDGDFIAVRKHFVSDRSLGAGEIWLYHRSGGEGLMMTARPTLQKDLGEPAFSPDGRYLYYSQDVTPGRTFEYNKDPHGTIYVVQRLDRSSGRVDRWVSAPGGSIAPTPSPDGRSLAFIRRRGTKSVLFVRDLASGIDRPLYDALDRDLQETWAVQGVYPGFDWTPDSRQLVFWAGGVIHRLDVASGTDAIVPFHVQGTRRMWKAARFPVAVHPPVFRTKMLRSVTVSPDGKRVVFQALGHLYSRDLPNGTPRRLFADDGVFEQHPAFSRDGRLLAYTTWSDRELGTVRVHAFAEKRSWVISDRPGHYAEPAFSPDGQTVVYRRLGADVTRPLAYTQEPGLYVVPARGGDTTLVLRKGARPHFAAEDRRVFFVDEEGEADATKLVLGSIELDGSDERQHVKVALGGELVVSPDGRWVGFTHNYQAYVAPLPGSGLPIELGPETKALPVVRVGQDAGGDLGFFAGGAQLHWSLGPRLFTRDLAGALAAVERAPGEKPPVAVEGLDLGFEVRADQPAGVVAFVGAKVVSMRGDEVIPEGAIVVEGNRVRAVGRRAEVVIPAGARVFDVTGCTIIPGLIDVHHHGPQGSDGITPQASWPLFATLAFGVTTVHDPSHDTSAIFAAAELARAGAVVSPRIFSTGTVLYGAQLSIKAQVETLEDARNHVRRLRESGAISVKSYRQRRRAQRQMLLTAARELGVMVVPEGGSMFEQDLTMVVDGHTGVEHALPVGAVYSDVVQLWSQSQVGYTPTLGVAYGGIWGENYWYAESDVFAHPRLSRFVPDTVLAPRSRRRLLASDDDWNHVRAAAVAAKLGAAGVGVNLGAHGQREGLAAHWELWMMVQGGMTPHAALRAGTWSGAHYLGLERDLGSIEPGKLADLAVIEGEVLADIRRSEKVRYTVINGRVYDAMTMNQLAPEPRVRPPLSFELVR